MPAGAVPPPDDGNDYILEPDGANVVVTEALRLTHANLGIALEERAMACMYGDSGLGKTAMVNAVLRHLAPEATIRLPCCPRRMREALFNALGLQGPKPRSARECDDLLKATLAEKFRVLVCDEAHWLPADCVEWWYHLRDDRTGAAIVFVGGADCPEVLTRTTREPMLSSRILLWQKFQRMSLAEVLDVIPAYHPIWAGADAKLLKLADRQAGHGNWRVWARLTKLAVGALSQLQRPAVDDDVLASVLDRLRPQWPL
ncbi:ATP-binding protein [Nonomuraea sp. NPDC049695]|uniref:ATP-binding protein n=1 Tax=Nonomuraea sp. NPDC049695 TaxID=3154734 RepID=UPI0034294D1E